MSKQRMSPVHPLSGYEVYVTAQDYLGRLTRGRADAQARELVSRVPRPVLLANLALLNKGQAGVGIERNVWDAVFLDCVEPATRSKLQNLLEGSPAGRGRRRLFFRQGILVAARFVVLNGRDEVDAGTESLHPLGVAGMLVHLLAVELGATAAGTELGPELFRSELFESATPSGDSMALYRRAWVDYETQVAQKVPGIDPPMHLASQALGADVEDVFSLVFALFAQAISSEQDVPPPFCRSSNYPRTDPPRWRPWCSISLQPLTTCNHTSTPPQALVHGACSHSSRDHSWQSTIASW